MTAQVELDPWHGAIVDATCEADEERAQDGERTFVRAAIAHEFCTPAACVDWPTVVVVYAIAPGLRIRQPLAIEEAVA